MSDLVALVDDDSTQLELLSDVLSGAGFEVAPFSEAAALLEAVSGPSALRAVVSDVAMPEMDGPTLCRKLRESRPDLSVIMVTAQSSVAIAVECLRAGAYDFLVKPVVPESLRQSVVRAVERHRLTVDLSRLQREHSLVGSLQGVSGAIRKVRDLVSRVADSQAPVYIQGATGTGKELVARALHEGSSRASGPFLAVNCAALPAALLESELFGHEKGAFTDAKAAKRGLFLEASGGTLFLDEIADLAPESQAKLLRALQERKVRPVGGSQEVPFDARVVCATHKDLEREVAVGNFRQDLFFRLNVVLIEVPTLAERGADILQLATLFLKRACSRDGSDMTLSLSPEVAERLLAYNWPGNVRELENTMERCAALARSHAIAVGDLPVKIQKYQADSIALAVMAPEEVLSLQNLEERYITRVLKLVGDNRSSAAKLLGIDRRTLYRKLDASERRRP
ncbi:MAG: sigma-54-dependent transcriptional regulator [Myxococcaceae bacterium]